MCSLVLNAIQLQVQFLSLGKGAHPDHSLGQLGSSSSPKCLVKGSFFSICPKDGSRVEFPPKNSSSCCIQFTYKHAHLTTSRLQTGAPNSNQHILLSWVEWAGFGVGVDFSTELCVGKDWFIPCPWREHLSVHPFLHLQNENSVSTSTSPTDKGWD